MSEIHPVCVRMRQLRRLRGWTLIEAEEQLGIPRIALGSYERGDRMPPLERIDAILAGYGYSLAIVPAGEDYVRLPEDIAKELRLIADAIAQERSLDSVEADGNE